MAEDKFELILLRNGKEVFKATVYAEATDTHVTYDEATFTVWLPTHEDHFRNEIQLLIELFAELFEEWCEIFEEVDSDGQA